MSSPDVLSLNVLRIYQEYLAKGVADKNAVLNTQMDQIINDANAEITRLQNKLSGK